jgi:hypothetical protein
MNDQSKVEKKVEAARTFLMELSERLPDMLKERARLDAGFRRRCYRSWKDGLDLVKMFLVMSQEFGSDYNERVRPRAFKSNDYRFEQRHQGRADRRRRYRPRCRDLHVFFTLSDLRSSHQSQRERRAGLRGTLLPQEFKLTSTAA